MKALPPTATVRAIRRLRHATTERFDSDAHDALAGVERRWLLWLHDRALQDDVQVRRYLSTAAPEMCDRELLRRRGERWYVVEHIEPPTILISTSAREHLRAVSNECRAIPSNSMYGIYLPDHVGAQSFTEWWNSPVGQLAVLSNARHYANGLLKLEPSDVRAVNVPWDQIERQIEADPSSL